MDAIAIVPIGATRVVNFILTAPRYRKGERESLIIVKGPLLPGVVSLLVFFPGFPTHFCGRSAHHRPRSPPFFSFSRPRIEEGTEEVRSGDGGGGEGQQKWKWPPINIQAASARAIVSGWGGRMVETGADSTRGKRGTTRRYTARKYLSLFLLRGRMRLEYSTVKCTLYTTVLRWVPPSISRSVPRSGGRDSGSVSARGNSADPFLPPPLHVRGSEPNRLRRLG